MNEFDDFLRIFYESTCISERILFAERYINDEEKQENMEKYINWFKNILKEGE